ncbi:Ig-like domain-containing protein [Terriglobus roseus]|uniref:Ig-like domain (Group 3) n=1 Tax=Terriglobus roseus TaxID=392734 RepID=A0A1G7KTH4_9BACT|nr:Ig-like domain-containing protein [Terriglobus roseus]SDF40230.1 Ig-like domain (group 3) [Terriglobus roseus]
MRKLAPMAGVRNGILLCLAVWIATSAGSAQVTAAPIGAAITPHAPTTQMAQLTITSQGSEANVQIASPAGVALDDLHVTLNGVDARELFSFSNCSTSCMTADLSHAGSAHVGQNTLYASVKVSGGKVLSTRYPFEIASGALSGGVKAMVSARSNGVVIAPDGGSAFNAPTVYFQTLTPGGWQGPGHPWIQVGSTTYPSSNTPTCSGTYFAVVLNRETLVEQTAAPESSPQCFSNGAALKTYLGTLTSADLAIVGTTSGNASDVQLNTASIGGVDHTSDKHIPTGYMAIGSGGTTAGSAYENYATQSFSIQPWPRANGFLQQDTSSNYNFQSSDAREIVVDPYLPVVNAANSTTGSVVVEMTAADKASTGAINDRYVMPDNTTAPGSVLLATTTNTTTAANGGYWLLVLDRTTLTPTSLNAGSSSLYPLTSLGTGTPLADCKSTIQGTERVWTNCGVLYPTGDSLGESNRSAALAALANDLNRTNRYFVVVLMSYGISPAVGTDYFSSTYEPNSDSFANALELIGGSARAPMYINTEGLTGTGGMGVTPVKKVYTLITSSDMGNPLTGSAVESTTVNADSAQTGYVHALMVRNQFGLFQPSQPSQQVNAADDAAAGPDFTISKMSLSQPVSWPALSNTPMPDANSAAGQQAAYRYISYELITQKYIIGATGSHLDDLHYYFTGSNANYLNYHYYDPRQLTFPGGNSNSYTWTDPITNQQLTFTWEDFVAVQSQTYTELVDFYNALNYLVTGPVNLKQAVASGDSSASSALIAAAANVLAGSLHPAASTPVRMNMANVLSMFAGVASISAAIASDGSFELVDAAIANRINKTVSAIGGGLSTAAAVTGGLKVGSTSNGSRYQAYATTIGTLAQSQLQEQYSTGFDLTADSLLSDWGRLSTIGPMTTDSDNATFYAPDQTSQLGAIIATNLATERSYYLSLMPSLYSVQRWHGVAGIDTLDSSNIDSKITNQPAAGTSPKFGQTYYPFYLASGTNNGGVTALPYSFVWTPTPGQQIWPSVQFQSSCPVDVWAIATPKVTTNFGANGAKFTVPTEDLLTQLFSSSGLAIPLNDFVSQYGPMQSAWQDMDNNTTLNTATGFQVSQITDARNVGISCSRSGGVGATNPVTTSVDTSTTLQAPASAVLGQAITLTAKVTIATGGGAVTGGSVYFVVDGAVAATVAVSPTGVATYSITPTVGQHTYQALYSVVTPYNPSQSDVATLTIYSSSPAIAVVLSQGTLTATYGVTTSPISVSVASMYGMTGTVQYSCSGLPIGMSCVFDSSSAVLAANTSVCTNVKIISQSVTSSGVGNSRLLALLSSALVMLLLPARRRIRAAGMLAAWLLASVVFLSGCSGSGSSGSNSVVESGTKTVLVNATVGTTTSSAPLIVTIK